ncbi:claudin-11b [Takifugu rubripes]|uniref:Claudin n=1 Tax=Takifugu rubripes TaxID=31033 RepID=Q6E5T2_TAKRU|nr:claudin-11 [Takifugu rubripes]AAT64081.1 claudin 11b [Takifugu rubripes]
MALMCRQIIGSGASCAGWAGLMVATATSDWVRTCDYSLAACLRMDELVSKGLWAECIISPALYHCGAREQILTLPAYVQTSRALMVCACLLGLPAMLLVLMSMPCIRLQNDSSAIRQRRSRVGGVLFLCVALCGVISTVWFPVGAHKDGGLMSFGFSLYAGWVGTALCLLGGIMILFCHFLSPGSPMRENSFYFSRQASRAGPLEPPGNHAKSARV